MALFGQQGSDWSGAAAPASDWSHLQQDPLSAGSASWAANTYGQYGYDPSAGGTGSYDPSYSSGTIYDAYSGFTTAGINADIDKWLQKEYPELFDFETGSVNSGFGGSAGDVSQNPNFGQFAKDPGVYTEIATAAAKYGVPANLLKVMIAKESSGDWQANSHATYLASRGERIVGYTGIMESTAKAWGYNFDQLVGNRSLQIDAMANGLQRLHQQYGGQYGWDGVISVYYSGDPTGATTPGDSYQYGTTQQYTSQVKEWWTQEDAWTASNGGKTWSEGASGMSSPNTSEWSAINQWDSYIANASKKYGVPANMIKAVMRAESQGIPTALSPQGASGLMQVMPGIHGTTQKAMMDPALNIDKGVSILRANYDQHGSWPMAAQAYLGLGGADAHGTTSNVYWQNVSSYWQELDGFAGGAGVPAEGRDPGPIMSLEAIWGGYAGATLTQEHGPTEFSQRPENAGMYAYSRDVLGGKLGHPGIDVGMPVGTQLFTPVGGEVMVAGGSGYYLDVSAGNSPQTGELRIKLDNGHEVILGHMAGIYVKPGTRVNPGQMVGVSGDLNGGHLHLEYRVPNSGFNGGWEAVDPREALMGVYGGGFSGPTATAGINRPMTYQEMMLAAARGETVDFGQTSGGGSTWNSWLQQAMTGAIPNRRTDAGTGQSAGSTSNVSQWGAANRNPWANYSFKR